MIQATLERAVPDAASGTDAERKPAPYMDAYLAGIGIGVALLAAYVAVGRGLGASGAFSSVAAAAAVSAGAQPNAAVTPYLGAGLLRDWLVLELIGVTLGGFVSARLAGRFRWTVDRGPRIGAGTRIGAALFGGVLMGVGAKLARGCTSGQALSGGALLATGSWIFIATCFLAGYIVAPLTRKLWT
jgi:uncharacterized protein